MARISKDTIIKELKQQALTQTAEIERLEKMNTQKRQEIHESEKACKAKDEEIKSLKGSLKLLDGCFNKVLGEKEAYENILFGYKQADGTRIGRVKPIL